MKIFIFLSFVVFLKELNKVKENKATKRFHCPIFSHTNREKKKKRDNEKRGEKSSVFWLATQRLTFFFNPQKNCNLYVTSYKDDFFGGEIFLEKKKKRVLWGHAREIKRRVLVSVRF